MEHGHLYFLFILIISENKPYNLRLCTLTFLARDLEVRVRILVQVQIFLLKFIKYFSNP